MSLTTRASRAGAAQRPAARVFYGWVIAWTSFAVLTLTYGVQFSFGVLRGPMVEDLGISTTEATLAFSVYVFVYSALSSVSGVITDRRGPRVVLAAAAVLLGGGYALTAASTSLWQLVIALGVVAGLGMSGSFVPCNATVVRWFLAKRGRALSVSTSGGSFAAIVMPLLSGWLIDRYSWRTLYLAYALVLAVGLAAASRIMVRDPDALGLAVDGEPAPAPSGADPAGGAAVEEPSLTAREAARTGVFWLVFWVFLLTWLVVFVPLAQLPAFAEGIGVRRSVAASLISAIGVGGMFGRLFTGSVSDVIGRAPALAIMLGAQAAAFTAFAASQGLWLLYPAAAVFGAAYGGTTTLFPAIVADRFGRAHVGAIVGVIFGGAGSMAAIGPAVAAWMSDLSGSYRSAFLLCGLVNLLALALVGVLVAGGRRSPAPA
ncbi:MAG: MFS transporter [Acidimicrobiales bacterium]